MQHLRLWRRFLTIAVAHETEYRANFLVGVVEGLVQLALAVLTFLVLYRFATTFPAAALLGRADPRLLPAGIVLAAVALYATGRFWGYAVRRYSSSEQLTSAAYMSRGHRATRRRSPSMCAPPRIQGYRAPIACHVPFLDAAARFVHNSTMFMVVNVRQA